MTDTIRDLEQEELALIQKIADATLDVRRFKEQLAICQLNLNQARLERAEKESKWRSTCPK